jgi:hypothetical protein
VNNAGDATRTTAAVLTVGPARRLPLEAPRPHLALCADPEHNVHGIQATSFLCRASFISVSAYSVLDSRATFSTRALQHLIYRPVRCLPAGTGLALAGSKAHAWDVPGGRLPLLRLKAKP